MAHDPAPAADAPLLPGATPVQETARLTASITPTAAPNFIYATYFCTAASDLAATKALTVMRRGGAQIGNPTFVYSASGQIFGTNGGSVMDAPGSTSALTYTVGIASNVGGNNVHGCIASGGGSMTLEEIQG